MIKCKTKKGTSIFVALVDDCEENKGGYFAEIYLHKNNIGEGYYDYFVIHKDEINCGNYEEVEKYVKDYVSTIDEY